MKSKILILLVVIIPLLFSCKDNTCDQNTSSLLQIGFYAYPRAAATPDTIDTLTIYGIGKAGYFLFYDSSVASLYLPLSMNMDSSSFVINSKGKKLDTLTINYTRHLQLISKECGFSTIFEITNASVTRHFFDSLKVTNSTVTTSYGENIRIFF